MRTAAAIGTFIVGLMVVSLLVVPGVSARNLAAPPLQATATSEAATVAATEAATVAATTAATEAATVAATEAATVAATTAATEAATAAATTATATTQPGTLPRTGGDSDMSSLWLLGGALLLTCLAVAFLVSSRRNAQL